LLDLAGVTRPDPVGSNPDAGAYESDKAQGDFDLQLSQCGYLLEAQILNTSSFNISWKLNGTQISTGNTVVATGLGTYVCEVISVDRVDTLTKTIVLNNPLTLANLTSKNNCSEVSNNNGFISWGNFYGGTPYNTSNWEYKTGIDDESGNLYSGTWDADEYSWSNDNNNVTPGKYYVWVQDGSGCIVGDTVDILDQDQAKYYVSTSGSDANDGLAKTTPFKTITHAVSLVCDLDQVVLLDGTYQEDSIVVDREIVLASEMYDDGDTNHISNTIIQGSNNWILNWNGAASNSWSDTATSKILGLTFYGGYSNSSSYASAVTINGDRALKLANVVFRGQTGTGPRALYNQYGKLSLLDVVVKDNINVSNASLMYFYGTDLHTDGLTFDSNTGSYYNGMLMSTRYNQGLDLSNVTAINNSNTSSNLFYWYYPQTNMDVGDIRISGNTYNSNAIYFYYGYPNSQQAYSFTFKNVLIAGNTTQGNPGIYANNISGNMDIINTTIANNTVASTGPVLQYSPYSSYTNRLNIVNSIFESNGSTAVALTSRANSTVTIKNTLINGGENGISNTGSMTLNVTDIENGFANLNPISFEPSKYSKSLGKGLTSAVIGARSLIIPTKDINGNNRPWTVGSLPDLGAIESPLDSAVRGISIASFDNGFCETADGQIIVSTLNYSGIKLFDWTKIGDATWTYPGTDSIATGLSSGDYVVAVLDSANAPIGVDTVSIGTYSTINITNQSIDAGCFADGDATLAFDLSGGNPYGGSQYYYSVTYLDVTPVNPADTTIYYSNYQGINYSTGYAGPAEYTTNSYDRVHQGAYYIEASDVEGCSVSDTIILGYDYELPALAMKTYDGVDSALTSLCLGTTLNLIADAYSVHGGLTYAWDNNSSSAIRTVTNSGEYHVIIEDAKGCKSKASTDIYFQSAPQLIIQNGSQPSFSGTSLSYIDMSGTSVAPTSDYLGNYNGNEYYIVRSSASW
ncbi:MAG: hypothetical protein ACKVJK_13115, partial [Methylophagaceae bacterium]